MATLRPQPNKLPANLALLATNARPTTLCLLLAPMASILSVPPGSASLAQPVTAVRARVRSRRPAPWVRAQPPASKRALLAPTEKNAPRSSRPRKHPALPATTPRQNRDSRPFASSVRPDISAQEAPTISSQNRVLPDHTPSDQEMPLANSVQLVMLVHSLTLLHMHAQLAMNNSRPAKLLANQRTLVPLPPAILATTPIPIRTRVANARKVSSVKR